VARQVWECWHDRHRASSRDVYGLIAMVQFARRQLKAAVTEDFVSYSPINSIEQLEDLSLALNTSA
jgi:hypothetical protein